MTNFAQSTFARGASKGRVFCFPRRRVELFKNNECSLGPLRWLPAAENAAGSAAKCDCENRFGECLQGNGAAKTFPLGKREKKASFGLTVQGLVIVASIRPALLFHGQ